MNSFFIFIDLFPIVLSCVLSLKDFKVLNNVVSSAYIIHLNMLLACEKSFIYIINSNGPRIEPCGTPTAIGRISDYFFNFNILFLIISIIV